MTSSAPCSRAARCVTRCALTCACPRRAKAQCLPEEKAMARSNKQWLRRHVTDPYVRKAREQGYRSRSAFKLLEIDDKEKLLRPGATVVDLGAAPGGWSQVAAARVKPGGRVIAIDLLKIAPITGVEVMHEDFRAAKLSGVRA